MAADRSVAANIESSSVGTEHVRGLSASRSVADSNEPEGDAHGLECDAVRVIARFAANDLPD